MSEVAIPEAVSQDEALSLVESFTSGVGVYSTVDSDDHKSRAMVAKAVMNATPLRDHDGPVDLVNFAIQAVQVNDEDFEEKRSAVRSILIDKSGASFSAVSVGVASSLRLIHAVMGHPSMWDGPVRVVRKNEGAGRQQVMTLKMV